jgi:hypothetical protein
MRSFFVISIIVFTFVSKSFATNGADVERYHGSDLKDVFLENERNFVDHISRFEVSALYSFYRISTDEQENKLTTDILSDFSSGFSVKYNKPFSMTNTLTFIGEYQRVIFQAPDSNELSDNNEDLFKIGVRLDHSFSRSLDSGLEVGGDSRLFLKNISDGIAEIKSIASPYIKVAVNPKMITKLGDREVVFKLDLGYQLNFDGEQASVTIDKRDTFSAGISAMKKINKTDYELGLEYSESHFRTNQSLHEITSLAIGLKISL